MVNNLQEYLVGFLGPVISFASLFVVSSVPLL